MPRALRIVARVVALLVLPLAAYGFASTLEIPSPTAYVDLPGFGAEHEIAIAEAYCERIGPREGFLTPLVADARQEARAACAAVRGAPEEARGAAAVAAQRAVFQLGERIQQVVATAHGYLVFLALAALLAVCGLGRIATLVVVAGAVLAELSELFVPFALVSLAPSALFLACAQWGERPEERSPRDATAALIVALLLVPLACAVVLGVGFSDSSMYLEKRLAGTTYAVALAWTLAGAPALVLAHRAARLAETDPRFAAKGRVRTARFFVWLLGMATAAAYYGSIRIPG